MYSLFWIGAVSLLAKPWREHQGSRIGDLLHQTRLSRLDAIFAGDYARTVNIAKGRVGFIEPMLARAVTKLPEGPAWTYELKFDGYRALGLKANGRVHICRFRQLSPSCIFLFSR